MSAPSVNLLQLSDTHLTDVPDGTVLRFQPQAQLERVLSHIRDQKVVLDGLIVTGDLVHDAGPGAYERLRGALDDAFGSGLPMMAMPGNHDDRAALSAVLGGRLTGLTELESGHLVSVGWFGQTRVIALDSHVPGAVWGELGGAQLAWLVATLAVPAPGGDLLALHHPVASPGMPWLDQLLLRDAAALAEALAGRDLLAIIAGHCHAASARRFGGHLALTAPAVAFQFAQHPPTNDRALPGAGYALHSVVAGQLVSAVTVLAM